ncbi:ABC transporter ATP-binding protein [Ruania halotolerans]|uniref:ABC transporter ATP-binding protein n=1 Tax=Ruania halotolerans TaxID=2897773 RepID=UPI001E300934|nr:ABC transporter ATP-binding protein [Ruania halotolerans]UFU07411.1 ABC transporter ATP-binding protein [Ruania halotolerans]
MTDVIHIENLIKDYGRTRALDGLDLRVTPGEVHGLLGPNGAGKTTTIRILLGLLRPTSGTAQLFGQDPAGDAVALHRRLAYVPGDVELWPTLTGGEAIDVFTRLRGGADPSLVASLADRFDLDLRKKGRTYSKGNRQKVALVAALASEVDLLILDEPTAGLDPLMEAVFQECIREAKEKGVSVLLSSHILAQVEALADRVSIVRAGATIETGTLAELRHLTRTTVAVRTEATADTLATRPGVHDLRVVDGETRFEVDGEQVGAVMNELAPLGISSIVAHPPTLEQLLLRHYGSDEDSRSTITTGAAPVAAGTGTGKHTGSTR